MAPVGTFSFVTLNLTYPPMEIKKIVGEICRIGGTNARIGIGGTLPIFTGNLSKFSTRYSIGGLLFHNEEEYSKLKTLLTACTQGSAPGPTLGNEYGRNLPYLPPHVYPQVELAQLPSLPSRTPSLPFGRYLFPVPPRVGGWAGLDVFDLR